jgi:hypothetical protein
MPFLRVMRKDTTEKELIGGMDSKFIQTRQHQSRGNSRLFSQTAGVFIPEQRKKEFRNQKFNEFIFISQVQFKKICIRFRVKYIFACRLLKRWPPGWRRKNIGGTGIHIIQLQDKATRWAPCIGS